MDLLIYVFIKGSHKEAQVINLVVHKCVPKVGPSD